MALDEKRAEKFGTPEWWMTKLARQMLDRNRLNRLATLRAYMGGRPPLLTASDSQRKAFYAFQKVSRMNYARPIVRSVAEGMRIRSIRTAAADDSNGDAVAWRNFTANDLDITAVDVHSDFLSVAEGYVRVSVGPGEQALATRSDPVYTITAQDPLNPMRSIAALHLVWDEWRELDFAYLWLPGEQWVASRKRANRPALYTLAGTGMTLTGDRAWQQRWSFPRMSFDATGFTMRPQRADLADGEDDGGPYCETFAPDIMPVVRFANRECIGEFEEHLDIIDKINLKSAIELQMAGVQLFRQRWLKQQAATQGEDKDRLPDKDPDSGEVIPWDEIFAPGPDALWKLPPGVDIGESADVNWSSILESTKGDVRHLSAVSSTPFSMFSPDGANQAAAGVDFNREGRVTKIEDRATIASRSWAQVMSLLFKLGPDTDRYIGTGSDGEQRDRGDAGQIVIDWAPAERYSLQERAQADSQNKTLSRRQSAAKIWGLTPDEVEINEADWKAEALLAGPTVAGGTGGTGGPAA